LKDITAVLMPYSSKAILNKAIFSLKKINARIKSVIVLQDPNTSSISMSEHDWLDEIKPIPVNGKDIGETINHTIQPIDSTYLLFLQDNEYLSPAVHVNSLNLATKQVLETPHHQPLLVRTSFLRKHKLLSRLQVPFKEALFPAWLSNVDRSLITFEEGLIKQARKSNSTSTIHKQKMIQKYQLENQVEPRSPTVSLLLSNYNMENYVEIAVASCLLQNAQPDQLLIMDDGSSDHSYHQLQKWRDGEKVQVFHKKNGGKARALNQLLPYVTSDFILELDADDWLDPDAISVIKKQLSDLPEDIVLLYGNLKKWKQAKGDLLFKRIAMGKKVKDRAELLAYRFPLGPRIYRTSSLKKIGGFPVIAFENGRLYEDVSVLNRLIRDWQFLYCDFTVYNVREHENSITKNNLANWKAFLKTLK